MYYLPLIINNRKTHICQLGTEQSFVPKFVVDCDGDKAPLIRIQHQAKIFADVGISSDLALEGKWETKGEDSNDKGIYHSYILTLNHRKGRPLNRPILKGLSTERRVPFKIEAPIKGEGSHNDLVLNWERGREQQRNHNFTVTIRLKVNDKAYEYKMEFHLSEKKHIYDVVFDFGSEASQMAFLSKKENEIKRVELLHLMNKSFYYPDPPIVRGDYKDICQFDPDDDALYSSLFLVKKENGNNDLIETDVPFEKEENSVLHLMINLLDYASNVTTNKYERIPNLKLTEFGSFRKFDITLDNASLDFHDVKEEFFQAILNQFFMLLIKGLNSDKRYAKRSFEDWGNIPKNIRITLLVPNIYDQQKISNLIKDTHIGFNQICQSVKSHPKFSNDLLINAVEVQTISESDAAFLGFIRSKLRGNLRSNSNYMIIDGGKGTLDISVIKIEEDAYNYNGIYRGGIAGAGNVLTYAFLENLAAIAVGTDDVKRKFFIKKILQVPIDIQFRLMRYIEILKRRYSNVEHLDETLLPDLKSEVGQLLVSPNDWLRMNSTIFGQELESVLKDALINPGYALGDYYGIIDKTMDSLTDAAIQIIKDLSEYSFQKNKKGEYRKKLEIEYVIFSGRSFLLKPFQELLVQKLVNNEVIANSEYVIWDEELAKRSCVEGPLDSPQGINNNSNLVGFPVPESMLNIDRNQPKSKSVLNGIEEWLADKFKPSKVNINKEKFYLSEKFFLEGLPTSKNDTFRVGDVAYNPREKLIQSSSKNDKTDVIFTGEKFKIRSHNNSVELISRRKKKNNANLDAFIWKSLFPHVDQANIDDNDIAGIPITKI